MRPLIGNTQRLDPQLLLDLQRLKTGAFFCQIRIHKISDPGFQRIGQLADKGGVNTQSL